MAPWDRSSHRGSTMIVDAYWTAPILRSSIGVPRNAFLIEQKCFLTRDSDRLVRILTLPQMVPTVTDKVCGFRHDLHPKFTRTYEESFQS